MEQVNFRHIIENLNAVIIVVDYDNKIVYANNYFCTLFNTNCNVIAGKSIFDFLPEHSDTIVIKDYTYKVTKFDDEKYSYFYMTILDNQMEKVYSDFISTVSHELRTPLTSIRGFADTMLMSYDRLDSTQVQKFMTIIKEQSNRLIKLVENLLSVSRIKVQQNNLVFKSVNVKSQIEQILDVIKAQYPSHSFVFQCENNVSSILADENKFQQIMINLLDNAAKYSFERGIVTVTVGNKDEKFVSIKVEDHGVGISQEDLKRIFDKFTRVENHLTRKAQGSGLGLYIVKTLVDKMGGEIFVTSSTQMPNSGSVFEILMPATTYTNQSKKVMEDR